MDTSKILSIIENKLSSYKLKLHDDKESIEFVINSMTYFGDYRSEQDVAEDYIQQLFG